MTSDTRVNSLSHVSIIRWKLPAYAFDFNELSYTRSSSKNYSKRSEYFPLMTLMLEKRKNSNSIFSCSHRSTMSFNALSILYSENAVSCISRMNSDIPSIFIVINFCKLKECSLQSKLSFMFSFIYFQCRSLMKFSRINSTNLEILEYDSIYFRNVYEISYCYTYFGSS